ncbi:MAG: metal-dependent hydrolase [Candidatus Riflebacteria bacterium]|nr:metal-dependent hydrolase [Candidatus Riflebacteria bacterium]
MNIITHALIGWCAGQRFSRHLPEVAIITVASVIPDIDAAGAVIDLARGGEAELFSAFHHKFGHCLLFYLGLLLLVHLLRKNARLTLWCALIFHLHLLCDVIGARGPDGYQWPVYYLFPFSDYGLSWSYQWEINAWPNILLTLWLLYLFLRQSAQMGFSPLSLLSSSVDDHFVHTLQKRFGFNKTGTADQMQVEPSSSEVPGAKQ